MQQFDTIIIGAGASGLMAATKYKDSNIALIEKNHFIGEKIKISGGGRCNITNAHVSSAHYLGNTSFVSTVLQRFNQDDLLSFLKDRNLIPVIRKEQQYFCEQSAKELIALFAKEIKNIPLFLGQSVLNIDKKSEFVIKTDKAQFRAKKLIIASGGLSYPKIGATPIAFESAQLFGHHINTLSPALVGFTVQKSEFWMKELSGISMPVTIRVGEKAFTQDLLFAHKGISGPSVLNASLYWKKGEIEIDFLPQKRIDQLLSKTSNKRLSTALPLPKRFVKVFLASQHITDQPLSQLDDETRTKLSSLHAYKMAPAGNFGYGKAEVTRGGIETSEIDPNTMMSQKCEGLFFIGECLDVTGELGGYNFQWAFSSAMSLRL